ncbi:MAG TPA: hypothetical protein VEA79_11100, partial [Phenylobacterium sp.]|nr:hypothetical protein [Phenylobacterium sp.]
MDLASHLPPRLRQTLLTVERPDAQRLFATGAAQLDELLGGGLARGALHEVYAETAPDSATAAGFTLALAMRAARDRAIVWARQDYAGVEAGGLYGPGLAALGFDPARLILVEARDVLGVLRAGAEAARCPAVGAVLMEPWGEAKALDLTASRRLALAAAQSDVTVFLTRAAATPRPSAAASRWSVRPRRSRPMEADAPGWPAFALTLLRHRAGLSRQTFDVEWDGDRCVFADLAPLSGSVAAVPAGGAVV